MSIILQDKYDYSKSTDMLKTDFGLSDEELFVIRQSNEYVAFVYLNGRTSLKTKYIEKYDIFDLGSETKDVIYEKGGREIQEPIKFNKFMVIFKIDKLNKFPSIDLKEYVEELKTSGKMDPEKLEFSLGFDVQKSSPNIMKLLSAGGFAEGFMPNYIGQPRSGKGINMRALIYQLGMFPLSEFLIIDKDKDLMSIHNAKKTIFQMDIADISAKPSRLINFFTYLLVYRQYKAQLLNKLGYLDYKSYYTDYYKQIKEGIEEGEKVLPAIPYTIIIYDEIKFQRAKFIEKQKNGDVFDSLIGSFLNVAPASGFKMIGATQEPNITSMGHGFKALSNIYFRVKYDVSDGVTSVNNKILNSDVVKSARLMNYSDDWIKPPFAKNGDKAINQYLTETMNGLTYLPERHYFTVNELFKSLSVDGSTSVILSSYKKTFLQLGFTEKEIEEIEGSDEFFIYIVLAYYMHRTFSISQLKPNLPIREATMNFDSNIDNTLFSGFMPLVSKDKADTIKNTILGNIQGRDTEQAEIFFQQFGTMMHGWYELEIKKSGIDELYGFENFKPGDKKVINNIQAQHNQKVELINDINISPIQEITQEKDEINIVEPTEVLPEQRIIDEPLQNNIDNNDLDLSFLEDIGEDVKQNNENIVKENVIVEKKNDNPFDMD